MILESTTYPGTTEELVAPILEARSGLVAGTDFALGYSPERIDPGNRTWTFETTPKVVSGVGPSSLRQVQAFYDRLVDTTVPVSSPKEAELTKLLENTFRHVNIALVNELAMFANDLGIDVWEAIDAASSKPFGYLRFTPGPGVGGHCLPIDPSYLSWRVRRSLGHAFRFVELANDVNDHMPDYVVRRAHRRAQRAGTVGQGSPHPAAGARLQAQHRRRPRVAVHADRPPAGQTWAPTVVAADPHVSTEHGAHPGATGWSSPPKRSPPPTPSWCWSTTTVRPGPRGRARSLTCSTPDAASPAPTSSTSSWSLRSPGRGPTSPPEGSGHGSLSAGSLS